MMIRRGLIAFLLGTIVGLLALEGLLRAFDPLGAAYFFDLETLGRYSITDDVRGYILSPGTVRLHRWSVTELSNGERYTPASRAAGCTLLILGDSVAFGQGINDGETFANLIARQVSLHVINAAFEGYNSAQVVATLRLHPEAAAVIYLISNNDMDPAWHFERPDDVSSLPMLSIYTMALHNISHPPDGHPDAARFWKDIAALEGDPRVVLVAFAEPFGHLVAERAHITLIAPYTHRVSFFDAHPSAVGHAEIASALLPIVRKAVQEHCTAVF